MSTQVRCTSAFLHFCISTFFHFCVLCTVCLTCCVPSTLGKLYNLQFLLPTLFTGGDFGVSSMMAGICRMIDLKEITPARRQFFRGMDGGSENVNYLGLGMNVTLVGKARAFDDLQQSRLPPDHSHHYQ